MEKKALDKLIDMTKKDPKFFHELVFSPETALGKLDFLDRQSKGNIVSISPEAIIAGITGHLIDKTGAARACTRSCANSCTNTCGAGSCDNTCTSSCTGTCGAISCGATSSLIDTRIQELEDFGDFQRGFFRQFSR